MQGTVVMLLALSGLGCHHKGCSSAYAAAPAYEAACYSSCYSSGYATSSCYTSGYSGCYSSGYSSCYSGGYGGGGCYSSCYSGGYGGGCYSSYGGGGGGCYSSCYSAPRHKHGLFGHKRRSCGACSEPAAAPVMASCDPCSMGYGGSPVYGTYTPAFDGYASGQAMGMPQSMGSSQSTYSAPAMTTPATPSGDSAPAMTAPSPGNPPPAPAPPTGPSGF